MHNLRIERNPLGRLKVQTPDGAVHEPVTAVRAFPIQTPAANISLVGPSGHEVAWIDRVSALPEKFRSLLEAELAVREFTPQIAALVSVSSFSTPSTWTVDTDRGRATFVLKSEDDIRRLGDGRLLIHSAQGLNFAIADRARLDKASRLLLERFL